MTAAFLLYIGKVAILVAVFYLFYRFLMERETFHRFNRAVLLISVLAAFVLPLCEITLYKTIVTELMPSSHISANGAASTNAEDSYSPKYFVLILFSFYIIGSTLKLLHTFLSIYRINRLIRHCEQHPQSDGTVIAVCPKDIAPFSWWNTIVFSRKDYELHDPALLAHEQAHINGYHSFDLLLMEIAIVLQWFNPAVWLVGRELRAIHEYEADASVLSGGIDTHHYLSLLMERANAKHSFALANSISQKTLKNRFQMMARHRSKPSRLLKVLYILPIVGITLAMNAHTVIETKFIKKYRTIKGTAEDINKQPIAGVQVSIKGEPGSTVSDSNGAYQINASDGDTIVWEYQDETDQLQINDTINYVTFVTDKSEEKESAQVTISGTVLDELGNPIIGAIALVHNSTLGTITDFDGFFSIKVPKGSVLDMMYIGVATQSIACNEDVSNLKVTLIKDNP